MKNELKVLIDKLAAEHTLSKEEYISLLEECGAEEAAYLAEKARKEKEKYYGNNVFIRGLIEISNICKNDCYYGKCSFLHDARPFLQLLSLILL